MPDRVTDHATGGAADHVTGGGADRATGGGPDRATDRVTDRVTGGGAGLVDTRLAWHAVAEHLLAGDLHRRTGRIGLRRTPGGFGQPEHLVDGVRRRLRVDGDHLVVLAGDVERWHPLRTLAGAADDAGTVVGAATDVYVPETVGAPDAPLGIDAGAAAELAAAFAFGEDVLGEVQRRHTADSPTLLQLWPEHLDLACTIGPVNMGLSPGDAAHAEPYLYVGPWQLRAEAHWNEPWGRSLHWHRSVSLDDAVAFVEQGLIDAAG